MVQSRELSSYEKQRLQNIEDNKKMLESLGLLRSFKPILNPLVRKKPTERKTRTAPPVKRKIADVVDHEETSSGAKFMRRRSLRVKGIEPDGTIVLPEEDEEEYKPKPKPMHRENYFGAPDTAFHIGYHWETRMGCSADGIHRPTIAGIHGNEAIGCYSIALSGGYEDDLDYGESFTFTGSGGRDLKGTKSNPKNLRTAPQSKDQTLDKMNLALSRNVESREPVRVIRGYKLQSPFAPEYGYRYDGLYTVEKCWPCTGLSGFRVYKYVLKRVQDQPPPPWKEIEVIGGSTSDKENEDPCLIAENGNIISKKDKKLMVENSTLEDEGTVNEDFDDEKKIDEGQNKEEDVEQKAAEPKSENEE